MTDLEKLIHIKSLFTKREDAQNRNEKKEQAIISKILKEEIETNYKAKVVPGLKKVEEYNNKRKLKKVIYRILPFIVGIIGFVLFFLLFRLIFLSIIIGIVFLLIMDLILYLSTKPLKIEQLKEFFGDSYSDLNPEINWDKIDPKDYYEFYDSYIYQPEESKYVVSDSNYLIDIVAARRFVLKKPHLKDSFEKEIKNLSNTSKIDDEIKKCAEDIGFDISTLENGKFINGMIQIFEDNPKIKTLNAAIEYYLPIFKSNMPSAIVDQLSCVKGLDKILDIIHKHFEQPHIPELF